MARLYADAGITFVVDDTPLPEDFADWYQELFADPRVVRIMLVADLATVVSRLQARNGPFDEQIIAAAEGIDAYTASLPKHGWTIVDNSALTIDETVAAVLSHLDD